MTHRVTPAAPVIGAVLVLLALLLSSGVGLGDAVALSGAVGVQTAAGALCWLLVTRGKTNGVELLGVGIALGTMATVLFAQVARAWPSITPVLAVLSVLTGLTVLITGRRRILKRCFAEVEPLSRRDWIGVIAAFALGLPSTVLLWLRHPLEWTGYRTFNVDTPFQQALAKSVSVFGSSESSLVSGGASIRYHWFAHGWIGALENWASTEPFVVLTRLVPLVAAAGTITVGWAWARRLCASWWTPPLAATLLIGGMYVGMAESVGDHMHRGVSPSQSLTSNWLLTFALVLTLSTRRLIPRGLAGALLAGVAFALVGGKVSHAAVVVGGMSSLLVLSSLQSRRLRRDILLLCAVSAVGILTGYAVLISGRTGGNRLALGFQHTVWSRLNLDPLPDTSSLAALGGILGATSLMAGVLPRWSGMFALVHRRRHLTPETMFGIGVAGTGLLLLVFTTQAGKSQVYFALSASLIISVLSAVGLERAWTDEGTERPRTARQVTAAITVGAGAGLAGYLTSAIGYRIGYGLQWAAPLLVWVVVLTFARQRLPKRLARTVQVRRRAMSLSIIALLVASVTSFQLVHAATLVGDAWRGPDTSRETGWHFDDLAAAKWLRANATRDDVVLTNRLCTSVTEVAPECSSRSFITSALAGTRMWIEGYDYGIGIGALPDWALERVQIAQRFTTSPRAADAGVLGEFGVRWVWLDCRVDCSTDFSNFGDRAFENDHVAIIKLRPAP